MTLTFILSKDGVTSTFSIFGISVSPVATLVSYTLVLKPFLSIPYVEIVYSVSALNKLNSCVAELPFSQPYSSTIAIAATGFPPHLF